MAVLAQGVSAAHHEEGAVHHVAGIENPSGGSVEGVAFEDFDHHHQHQSNDEPRECLAHPSADFICCVQQFLCIHKGLPKMKKTHPGKPNGFQVKASA